MGLNKKMERWQMEMEVGEKDKLRGTRKARSGGLGLTGLPCQSIAYLGLASDVGIAPSLFLYLRCVSHVSLFWFMSCRMVHNVRLEPLFYRFTRQPVMLPRPHLPFTNHFSTSL